MLNHNTNYNTKLIPPPFQVIDVFPDVYKLPSPIKLDPSEPYVDLRIPSPIPQPDEHLDINVSEDDYV